MLLLDSVFSHLLALVLAPLARQQRAILWSLAWLEQRQNAATRSLQGLDPLDDAERAQFLALCY